MDSGSTMICRSCGATFNGFYCGYCGSHANASMSPEEEVQQVREFHRLLISADQSRKEALLSGAYLPRSTLGLREAGLNLLPMLDTNGKGSIGGMAAHRLESIIARLSVAIEAEGGRASGIKRQELSESVAVMEKKLRRFRREDNLYNAAALFVVVLCLVFFAALVVYGLKYLWS
jgi:hypothetical protein